MIIISVALSCVNTYVLLHNSYVWLYYVIAYFITKQVWDMILPQLFLSVVSVLLPSHLYCAFKMEILWINVIQRISRWQENFYSWLLSCELWSDLIVLEFVEFQDRISFIGCNLYCHVNPDSWSTFFIEWPSHAYILFLLRFCEESWCKITRVN